MAGRHKVGAVVCVQTNGMKEAWHLAASDAKLSARQIVNLTTRPTVLHCSQNSGQNERQAKL